MSLWDLLPKNIKNLIFQFDPTYHNIHKDNLKFLQKQWSIKYINKNTGSWGWDITCSAAMLHGNPKCDVYESIAYTTYSGLTDSLYDAKNLYKLNFNRCQKICRDLNHKYSNYYHIPDHLKFGDIYDFDKNFFIREYASLTAENLKSIDVYPKKWKSFKDKMKKIYKI